MEKFNQLYQFLNGTYHHPNEAKALSRLLQNDVDFDVITTLFKAKCQKLQNDVTDKDEKYQKVLTDLQLQKEKCNALEIENKEKESEIKNLTHELQMLQMKLQIAKTEHKTEINALRIDQQVAENKVKMWQNHKRASQIVHEIEKKKLKAKCDEQADALKDDLLQCEERLNKFKQSSAKDQEKWQQEKNEQEAIMRESEAQRMLIEEQLQYHESKDLIDFCKDEICEYSVNEQFSYNVRIYPQYQETPMTNFLFLIVNVGKLIRFISYLQTILSFYYLPSFLIRNRTQIIQHKSGQNT